MLAPLALWSTLAGAADLSLTATFPDAGPRSVLLADVDAGLPPAVVFPGEDGRLWSVSVRLEADADGAARLTAVVERLDRDRKGRLVPTTVLEPTVRIQPGRTAEVFVGKHLPIPATDPPQYRAEGIRLELRIAE